MNPDAIIAKMGFEDLVEPEVESDIPLLVRVLACTPESIELALGKFGKKLKAFAHAVDLKHPHVKTLFQDVDGDFCQDVIELIDLAEFAQKKKMTRMLPTIGGKVVKDLPAVLKTIDSPFNNRYHIRLLRTQEERDRVRAEKKIQTIDLTTVNRNGEEVWASLPSNLNSFIRWGAAYQDEINCATKKAHRYIKLGCTDIAKRVLEKVEQFKVQSQDVYYGFNRITMTNTAVIVAKLLGYKLTTEKKLHCITVPGSLFGDYHFEHYLWNSYDYEPRVYPLHKLRHLASEYVNKIIDHLEAFPKASGKAIFDSYAVIVPGICYPRSEDKYSILDRQGNQLDFETREEAIQALDINLIEGGFITPILLGEYEGKCFFISFYS